MMTIEEQRELVEEAKRRFPKNTRFISCMDREDVIKGEPYYTADVSDHSPRIAVDGVGSTGRLIYLKGKWATVMSLPPGYIEPTNEEYTLI